MEIIINTYPKFDPTNPPPPLMTGEPNSFAHRTITTRIPAIVQQVLADHGDTYPPEIVQTLQDLRDEVRLGRPVRPLETDAPDGPSWTKAWQPHRGKSWHNIPWYFAEAFFYRHLLEAAGYFGGYGDKWAGVDPFKPRKLAELQSHTPWQVLAAALSRASNNSAGSFHVLLHHCVWGNRVDLSYNQVAETGRQIVVDSEQVNLLVDDTEAVLAHLTQGGWGAIVPFGYGKLRRLGDGEMRGLRDEEMRGTVLSKIEGLEGAGGRRSAVSGRIDFICDNTGTELLLDLALADFLLRFDWAGQVILHVKAHPTFVSDATPGDIEWTLTAIKEYPRLDLPALAARLENYREQHRLEIQADLFWNSSRFFWEMPSLLQTQLAQARLVIIKGDANYRRLLGDSRWPTTVPVADAIPYFPTSFVALRTMKSDPVVGLQPGQAEALDQVDPEWRVNGKRGMIQAVL